MEFESDISGCPINGADFLKWNSDGEIEEFKVMVRPKQIANVFCGMMTEKIVGLIEKGQ